eukprot:5080633-Pleurochrysis_carterae.AAC.1
MLGNRLPAPPAPHPFARCLADARCSLDGLACTVGVGRGAQVNSLEMEMLRMISFSLFVQPDHYERCARQATALREDMRQESCSEAARCMRSPLFEIRRPAL